MHSSPQTCCFRRSYFFLSSLLLSSHVVAPTPGSLLGDKRMGDRRDRCSRPSYLFRTPLGDLVVCRTARRRKVSEPQIRQQTNKRGMVTLSASEYPNVSQLLTFTRRLSLALLSPATTPEHETWTCYDTFCGKACWRGRCVYQKNYRSLFAASTPQEKYDIIRAALYE